MFTGIITDIGTVAAVERRGDVRFKISCGYELDGIAIGASIACSGVCLTVTEKDATEQWFAVDVSAESVDKTTLGDWATGRRVNLERSLRVGDELGGHIVTGHVDGVGVVEDARPDGDSTRVDFLAPAALAPFIAAKGSVAVDGCSLTVNTVDAAPDGRVRFAVNLIPHTKRWTTFDELRPDTRVNLEIDVLARYVARLKDVYDRA